MQIRITILRGKDSGTVRLFRVEPEQPIVIGRHEECDLPLLDEAASRRHAMLEVDSNKLLLTDLGSSNGTIVNGEPVHQRAIRGGDRISIGETEFKIETEGFHRRETVVLRHPPAYQVESTLRPDEVDLGSSVNTDSTGRRRLKQLLDLIRATQEVEDGREVLDGLLQSARDALPCRVAAVVPCASGTTELLWEDALGGSPELRKSASTKSILERVSAEGEALRITDSSDDPQLQPRESMVRRGVLSILAAPIQARSRIEGVLYLDRDREPEYSAEDLTFAATLAQIAGMALHSVERVERSRRVLATRDQRTQSPIITGSARLEKNLEHLRRFSHSGGPVLIVGETGTGKELFAQEAHRAGPYATGSFIPVNCAAIPASLLESELFGHEKGAFTGATGRKAGMFELANGGTLFLDEIGDLPLELQPKLLRVLETGSFFRIGGRGPVSVELLLISATHRDLEQQVREGGFREDLYFRLNRFRVESLALRERPEDITLLADRFLELAARRLDRELRWSAAARGALERYSWPGNVRELRNVVERASVVAQGPEVLPDDLLLTGSLEPTSASSTGSGGGPSEPRSLDEVEEEAIRVALRHTGGKKGEAAEILGIAWPTLRRKLKKYDIDADAP